MKKAKIVIDIERMKYPYTGLHNYCENLYTNLQTYGNDYFYFYFYLPYAVELNSEINRIDTKFWNKLYLKKPSKFKLWHITYQNSKYVPFGNVKIIYTIHDLNFLYTDKPESKKKKLLKKIQKKIDKADYITVISNFVLNDVKKHLDLKNKPIKVVYNGVKLTEYPNFSNPKYRPKKKFILTIGTVLFKKYFHVLPQLVDGLDYELIIAGIHSDKNYIDLLEEEIKKHHVKNKVKLIGTITEEEKYWYIKNCSAFVFPSISEGFGIPPIEAMLMGKPVFLSTYTSLPEIGGNFAYYFNSFDKDDMQKVFTEGIKDYNINNKETKIIEWAKQFNWGKATKNYIDIYKQVLGLKITKDSKNLSRSKKLTALIITYNEEDNIKKLLENVNFADEIIVVDSCSTDRTLHRIKEFSNVRIIQKEFINFSKQRNFAIEQASNDWILFIDADERISNALKNEILEVVENPSSYIAFKFKRKNFIAGKHIKYSGWQNDVIYRLFNKKQVKYDENKWVHETLIVNGKTKVLDNEIFHYTFKSYHDYKNKIELYSKLKAKELYFQGVKPSNYHFIIKPFYRFIYHYFIKLGLLDGRKGKFIAKINAYGVKSRYIELKKLYQNKNAKRIKK